MRMRAGPEKFINKKESHDVNVAKRIRLKHALIVFTCLNGTLDTMCKVKDTLTLNSEVVNVSKLRLCHPVSPYVTPTIYSLYITAGRD